MDHYDGHDHEYCEQCGDCVLCDVPHNCVHGLLHHAIVRELPEGAEPEPGSFVIETTMNRAEFSRALAEIGKPKEQKMSSNADEIMNEAEIQQFVAEVSKQPRIAVTLGKLVESSSPQEGVPGAIDILLSKSIPILKAHAIAKIAKTASIWVNEYKASKKLLLDRFVSTNEAGRYIILDLQGKEITQGIGRYKIDKLEEFNAEARALDQLLADEMFIEGKRIALRELGKIITDDQGNETLVDWNDKPICIEAAYMMQLDWLIE